MNWPGFGRRRTRLTPCFFTHAGAWRSDSHWTVCGPAVETSGGVRAIRLAEGDRSRGYGPDAGRRLCVDGYVRWLRAKRWQLPNFDPSVEEARGSKQSCSIRRPATWQTPVPCLRRTRRLRWCRRTGQVMRCGLGNVRPIKRAGGRRDHHAHGRGRGPAAGGAAGGWARWGRAAAGSEAARYPDLFGPGRWGPVSGTFRLIEAEPCDADVANVTAVPYTASGWVVLVLGDGRPEGAGRDAGAGGVDRGDAAA